MKNKIIEAYFLFGAKMVLSLIKKKQQQKSAGLMEICENLKVIFK